MFRSSRRRRGPDVYLDWKVRLFFLGAFLALIGMATDRSWVVGVAIGVLAVGMVLKFFSDGGPEDDSTDETTAPAPPESD